MPGWSRWMIGYGVLLVVCDVVGSRLSTAQAMRAALPALLWLAGATMILAGVAAALRRRSIRLTGMSIGVLVPLALAGSFTWRGAGCWRQFARGEQHLLPCVAISALAVISVLLIGIIMRTWPKEGIASRGYVVTASAPRPAPDALPVQPHEQRRSEAG